MNKEVRFPIGTQFKTRGKHPKICTVIDILKTYNNSDELVSIRYVATHEFLGQLVKNYDVVDTTIAMGLIKTIESEVCHCGDTNPHNFTNDCVPF